MLSETALLWTGTIALLINYVALQQASTSLDRALALVFALLFWIAYSIGASNYTVYTAGSATTVSSQSLALIGLIAIIATFLLLVQAAFESIQ
jgi:hypothetical protein